jgi:hypothetical protein
MRHCTADDLRYMVKADALDAFVMLWLAMRSTVIKARN